MSGIFIPQPIIYPRIKMLVSVGDPHLIVIELYDGYT